MGGLPSGGAADVRVSVRVSDRGRLSVRYDGAPTFDRFRMAGLRPSSSAAPHRAPPQLPQDKFAPPPLQRPKSALTLRVRGQLSHVKGMATQVLKNKPSLQVEDLATGKLLLDRDSEVAIERATSEREHEMRDIVDRRQRKYDLDRLSSDKKEDMLGKMMVELDVLETAKAAGETANRVEEATNQRLDDIRDETQAAEEAMAEAVEYTETLRMMTQRLVADITNRRKLQHEIDRAIGELKRELHVVTTHQRVIAAAERDAFDAVEKLEDHLEARRRLQDGQLARRKALADSFTMADGYGGKDLVADARAKLDARNSRMRVGAAQQASIRWTLDGLKNMDEKMHIGAGAPPANAPGRKPTATRGNTQPLRKSSSASKVGGRKVSLPFSSAEEVKRLSGAVNAEEVQAIRTNTFSQYMQAVYAKTGTTDGPFVLRRLHHWVRTEKSVQVQSVAAQKRYETLRKEMQGLAAELSRMRADKLLEPAEPNSTMRTNDGGASARSGGGSSPIRVAKDGEGPSASTAETNSQLDAVTAAKARLSRVERLSEIRTRTVLDVASSLNNLVDKLKAAAPVVAKEVRQKLSSRAPSIDLFSGGGGQLALEAEEAEDAAADDDEVAKRDDDEDDDEPQADLDEDEATKAYNVFVKQVPRKIQIGELFLAKLLEIVEAAGPIDLKAVKAPEPATAFLTGLSPASSPTQSAASPPKRLSAATSILAMRRTHRRAPSVACAKRLLGSAAAASPGSQASPNDGGVNISGWGDGSPEAAKGAAANTSDEALVGNFAFARRSVSAAAEAEDYEENEEVTADEACVHTLARERSGLKRTSTWNAGAQDPAPSSRVKRSWSRPELGTGGVLDRNERKIDSANLIHGEEDRKAREIREKERVKREGVQPRYMQAKN